jgi:hypothetical protein
MGSDMRDVAEKADIEGRARVIYARQTQAWTGEPWPWEDASDEVKERFRGFARADKRPPLPHEEDGFTDFVSANPKAWERG